MTDGKSQDWRAAEAGFGTEFSRFDRLSLGRSSRNYLAVSAADGRRHLVKFGWESAVRIMKRIDDRIRSPLFVPLSFEGRIFPCGDKWCCAQEWVEGAANVLPEDLTVGQIESLLLAYSEMSSALQALAEGCAQGERMIHGDLQAGNILYSGDRVRAFIDFEEIRPGHPSDDLLRVFVHRLERTWSRHWRATLRVYRAFRETLRRSEIPAEEWLAAIDRYVEHKNGKRAKRTRWRLVHAVKRWVRAPLYGNLRRCVRRMHAAGFEAEQLKSVLERALGFRLRSFDRLKCVNAVNFKAVRDSDGFAFCVKCFPVADRLAYDRLILHLRQLDGLPTVAKRIFADECPVEFKGFNLICLSWCEGERLSADKLTRRQLLGLVSDYQVFSRGLRNVTDLFPSRPYLRMRQNALSKCRGLGGWLLRPEIEAFDESMCHLRPECCCVIHGDFHPGNLVFSETGVSGFFDFDELQSGYPTMDFVRYFIFSIDRLKWFDFRARRRTMKWFAEAIRNLPYAREQWLVAIGVLWMWKLEKKIGRPGIGKVGIVRAVVLRSDAALYRRLYDIVNRVSPKTR